MFCGDAAGECKKPPGWSGRKNSYRHLRRRLRCDVEVDPWPAALGWSCSGHLLRGKELQALDMDAVLPVTHLEFEEASAAADDGVWVVIQQCKWGVVSIAAYQTALRGAQCFWNGFRWHAVHCGVVLCLCGVAALQVRGEFSRASSRGHSGVGAPGGPPGG